MSELPLTFDTLAIEQPGAPVRLKQKAITALEPDEALVRVHFASINKMDPMLALRNVFQLPSPYVLGFDFSGEIARLGSEGGFQIGDQVFGSNLAGGGFGEYLVVKKSRLIPRGVIPSAEASTYGVAFMTAYESLVLTAPLAEHKGKTIYIAGAAGGVGHFAAQLAKMFGLKVIGSAGKAASLDLLKRLRVDHIIDYSRQEVSAEIMKLTQGKGVDLVYDSTYNDASYDESTAVIASGGLYIRLGTPEQLTAYGLADKTAAVKARGAELVIADAGRYSRDPVYQPQAPKLFEGLHQAVTWYKEGTVRPVVTQTVSFNAASLQTAFDEFVKGTNNVGKVVVQVKAL